MFNELETKIRNLKEEIKVIEENYTKAINEKNLELKNLKNKLDMVYTGINIEYVDRAKEILYVNDIKNVKYGDCPKMVEKAINDVLDKFKTLRREYFGAKDYERWSYQGFTCSYGYCPTYGNIVFEIGMKDIARAKENFTNEEIDACLYFLRHLNEIADI